MCQPVMMMVIAVVLQVCENHWC